MLRRWATVPVAVLALIIAGLAAATPGITGAAVDLPEPPPADPDGPGATGQSAPPPAGAGAEAADPLPAWLEAIVVGLVFVLPVTALGLILYVLVERLFTMLASPPADRLPLRRQAASQPADPDPDDVAEIRAAVAAGLADLDAGGDPRRAVIACWLRLERVAAAAGVARDPADTPTDLVVRLLTRTAVSEAALGRLADAYRLARYAPVTIGADLAAAATRALAEVAGQLPAKAGSAAGGASVGGAAGRSGAAGLGGAQ